jgi:hypothetical protein
MEKDEVAGFRTDMLAATNVLSLQWLRDLGTGTESLIQQTYLISLSTHRAILAIHSKLSNNTERSLVLAHEPIRFENAKGRTS